MPADNKLAALSDAETRTDSLNGGQGADTVSAADCHDRVEEARAEGSTLGGGEGADTLHGGQGADSLGNGSAADTLNAGKSDEDVRAETTGNTTGEPGGVKDATTAAAPNDQVDAIVSRTEPEKDKAASERADESATGGGATLNAGSVDNKGKAPDEKSQATGNSPANKYPAPTPTRDSAVHQLDMKIAELAYFVNDFNHELDPGRQALVDQIRAYRPG